MNHFKKLILMTTITTAALTSCGDNAEKKSEASANEKITKVAWGEADGKQVDLYTLTNANGVQVKITTYGLSLIHI